MGVETYVQNISRIAQEHFGGFDTWVNNAASGTYGRLTEVQTEDHRKVFETNFWGVVYGSLEAVKHLRKHGGTLMLRPCRPRNPAAGDVCHF